LHATWESQHTLYGPAEWVVGLPQGTSCFQDRMYKKSQTHLVAQ
jgi:hypothetical protein